MTLAPEEYLILRKLAELPEYHCVPFAYLEDTGIDPRLIPHLCRLLRARGLAEHHNGLWTENGRMAGAGYRITDKGRELMHVDRKTA